MKELIFITVLLLTFNVSHSQKKGKSLEIDVFYDSDKGLFEYDKSKNFDVWKQKKKNPKYFFNVNKYDSEKHQVHLLSAKPINYKVGVPDGLKAYFGLVNLDQTPETPGPVSAPSITFPQKRILEHTIDTTVVALGDIKAEVEQQFKSFGNYASTKTQPLSVQKEYFEYQIELQKLDYARVKQDLKGYQAILNSYEVLEPLLDRYDKIYQNVLFVDLKVKTLIKALTRLSSGYQQKIDQKLQGIKDRYGVKTSEELINAISSDYYMLKGLNETIEEVMTSGFEVNSELIKSLSSVNSAQQYLDNKIKINEILTTLKQLSTVKSSVKSKEIIYGRHSDATRLQLIMTNRFTKDTVLAQTLDVPVYKGIDIEFSTGFIYNSLWQRDFYLESNINVNSEGINDTTQVIKKQEGFRGDITFAAFSHFSLRKYHARYGASLGVGIGLTDGKPRYLLGLHAMFLKKQALGVTGGLALAQIKTLSDAISDDGIEPNNPVARSLTSVPTTDRMRSGYYFGIVWNFARK